MILLSGLEIFFIILASILILVVLFFVGTRKLNESLAKKIVNKSPFIIGIATTNMKYNFKKVDDVEFEKFYGSLEDAQSNDGDADEFASYLVLNEAAIKDLIYQCEYNKTQYSNYEIEYGKLNELKTTKKDKHGINLPYFFIKYFESIYYQFSRLQRSSEHFCLILRKKYHDEKGNQDVTFTSECSYEKIKEILGL